MMNGVCHVQLVESSIAACVFHDGRLASHNLIRTRPPVTKCDSTRNCGSAARAPKSTLSICIPSELSMELCLPAPECSRVHHVVPTQCDRKLGGGGASLAWYQRSR